MPYKPIRIPFTPNRDPRDAHCGVSHAEALLTHCPRCCAEPGEKCRKTSGKPGTTDMHGVRHTAAQAAKTAAHVAGWIVHPETCDDHALREENKVRAEARRKALIDAQKVAERAYEDAVPKERAKAMLNAVQGLWIRDARARDY